AQRVGGSVLAWLFLALLLLLAARGRAISASHLWMFSSHLGVTRPHLWIMCFIHPLGSVSCACPPGCFAGVHFRLVCPHVSLVPFICVHAPGPVFPGFSRSGVPCPCSLPILVSHISAVGFSFSRSAPRPRSLPISYAPPFVSSFSSSRCC